MAQLDVFSLAISITALLVAAGFGIAYLIDRRLTAFRWWAASFVLLAIALATATLRFDGPSYWIKMISWASFYGAACLIAIGLYQEGATRTNPLWAMLAGGILYLAIATTLIATLAPPHFWFLLGPVPTLVFLAWAMAPMLRARAWGYSLAVGAGMMVIAMRALWYTTDLIRMGPIRRPLLRGSLAPNGEPPTGALLGRPAPPEGIIGFRPPPGVRVPIEQPLTIALITLAAILGLALVLVLRDVLKRVHDLQQRSTTDGMTGLLNRATFDDEANLLLQSANHQPVCLILLDIDHFKRINDTCGHLTGDMVIARLGQLIITHVETGTVAGRIGGEEFAVLFKGTGLSAARLFAEALRTRFAVADLGDTIGWPVTLSAGIAQRDQDESLSSLIARADKALYAAKSRGRNQVAVATRTAQWHLRQSLRSTG